MPPAADDVRLDAMAAAGGAAFARFTGQLYARVAPADLSSRPPEALLAAAQSLWELAAVRQPRRVNLRVIEAPAPPRTIVEIVNDDMPFLLDSVTMAISGEGLTLYLAVHPIMAVRRDAGGALLDVYPPGTAPDGAAREIPHAARDRAGDRRRRARQT